MQWSGPAYSMFSEPQYVEASFMLQNYCHPSEGNDILDVGCGDGRITHDIATKLFPLKGHVVGVDLSTNQIDHATTTHHAPNLSYEVADVLHLPSKFHNKFDWVVSFSCLHRVKDLTAAFSSMSGCTKKGGRILFSFPSFPPFMELLFDQLRKHRKWGQYFEGMEDPFPWKVYPNFEDETPHGMKEQRKAFVARIEGMLESVGLDPQQVELRSVVSSFRDEEEMKNSISQWLDYRQKVPEDLQQNFMNDFMDAYREVMKDRAFSDLSHYAPDRYQGVRIEHVQVRALAIKPLHV